MKIENDILSENLKYTLEIQDKFKSAYAPMLETQEKFKAIAGKVSSAYKFNIANPMINNPTIEAMKSSMQSHVFDSLSMQIHTSVLDTINQINISLTSTITDSIKSVLEKYNNLSATFKSPAMAWFQSFDFTPIKKIIRSLKIEASIAQEYEKLNEIYLQTMYETKWFPYAGWIADISLFKEVNNIIASSRGASKNREKRIDKAIISYYTDVKIRAIKKTWWKSELDYCIRKAICQSINAYLRGEYALTISCLSTVWEGLIYMKAKDVTPLERKRQRMQETKQELKELVEHNDYKLIFSDYFDNFIVSNCNEVNDVIDGVPNRHGVAHSWYKKYPNKKAALNAILLTDFIIDLQPIE